MATAPTADDDGGAVQGVHGGQSVNGATIGGVVAGILVLIAVVVTVCLYVQYR